MVVVAWISFTPACTFDPGVDTGGPGSPDAGRLPDAGFVPDASLPVDAAIEPDAPLPPAELHLLLTEVKTQPSNAEFIEIWNPLDEEVALRDYYLTDDKDYDVLPERERLGTEVPVGQFDAILRFPDGAVLGPGEVAVVALDEQGFTTAFVITPDYVVRPATVPVATAMEIVADGSISMELTDVGEAIALFRWDGESDLVTDVDIVVAGNDPGDPGAENGVPDKTGEAIDGPDADEVESTYAADAATMPAMMFRSGNGGSYKRIALETGAEVETGGNGVFGHDETSEDTLTTWNQLDTPPTPGVVPPLAGR
jgi:hypothetical protein